MDVSVIIATINAGVALAGLAAGLLASYLAYKSKQLGLENQQKIEVVHKATNSMKDELVAEVRAASLAKGKLEGRTEARKDLSGSA